MSTAKRCDGLTRRDLVCVGGLSAFGFGLPDFFRLGGTCVAAPPEDHTGVASRNEIVPAKAKSCILIWLDGGPTHLETFDPKPNAPSEIRGPMATVGTSLPGIRLNECLMSTAAQMDNIAVVRSMTSPLGEHNFGTHYLMTGYKPSPALDYPTFGSTLAQVRAKPGVLPSNIAVPRFSKNIDGRGFLPKFTEPFSVGGNPGAPGFQS